MTPPRAILGRVAVHAERGAPWPPGIPRCMTRLPSPPRGWPAVEGRAVTCRRCLASVEKHDQGEKK